MMNEPIELRKSRILVVDDDELLNLLFCGFLESKDFEVLSACGVSDAKKILQSDADIDVVLLDYQLSDGVGMDLMVPDVAATYLSHAPVIMISANEAVEFLEECFRGGVNDYIIKPVNLSLLALKVDSLIKTVTMSRLIATQKSELEKFKQDAEREEQVAKFTYEYLLSQYSQKQSGIDVWLKSSAAFSGDMALTKKSPSGSLYFMLADATGHGLSAAITIMPVLTIFNSMVAKGFHVQQIVTELNRKLLTDTPADRFVAASIVEVNPFRGEINVWCGSMPSVYWINDGLIVHEFSSKHMALGILDDDIFDASVETLSLPRQGFIFTFSDGLNEQENTQGVQFSKKRVLDIVSQQPKNIILELAQALNNHAETADFSDDVSICVIDPHTVFNGLGLEFKNVEMISIARPSLPFSWEIKLTGKKLQQCDIAPLCNHFLQQITCDQSLCQKIFAIVAEMVSNAIDHGVLKLPSELKEDKQGFIAYFDEREKRMNLVGKHDFVKVSLMWDSEQAPNRLLIEVEDSGEGYVNLGTSADGEHKFFGRGSNIIKLLSESVEIFPPGNKIRAIVK